MPRYPDTGRVRLGLFLLLIVIAGAMVGCGSDREPPFALTRITIRTGDAPATAVDRYADQILAELFPAGFSRVEGRWQQRNRDGSQVSEPCVVFDIVHLASADNDKRVEGALLVAKRQFGVESVLVLEGRPDVRR